jgi:hypothetical protein
MMTKSHTARRHTGLFVQGNTKRDGNSMRMDMRKKKKDPDTVRKTRNVPEEKQEGFVGVTVAIDWFTCG